MTTQYAMYAILRSGKKLKGVYHVDEHYNLGAPVEITERIYNGCDCYPWMEVRAWLPVKTIGGKYVWGKKIYKRKYWAVWGNFHMEPIVEYATVFDMVKYAEQ